jgi:hypothetical protein
MHAPERLLYTSRFDSPGFVEPFLAFVRVDFDDLGCGKTRVALTQQDYPSAAERNEQEQGWPRFLDQLAKLLDTRPW